MFTSRKTLLTATLAALAFVSFSASAQDKVRLAGNFEIAHSSSVAMEQVFKPELAKLTKNALQVDLFPAMQLGGAKENVDAVRAGSLLMTWTGAAYMSRIVTELEAVSLPFLFPRSDSDTFTLFDATLPSRISAATVLDVTLTLLGSDFARVLPTSDIAANLR